MPGPDVRSTIVSGHLQNVSLDWKNKMFSVNDIIPPIMLPTRSAQVTKYNRGDAFRDTAEIRARGTKTASSNYKMEQVDISTNQYANKNKITKEDLRDAGLKGNLTPPLNMKGRAIAWNSDKLDLKNEILTATAAKAATWLDGVGSGGQDAEGLWAAADGTNTFIEDVDTAVQAMQDAGIPRSNIRVATDSETFSKIIRCSDMTTALGYNATAAKAPGLVITAEMIATLLTIDKLVITSSIYNSANENAAGTDFTPADIWGGTKGWGFVYYFPPTISREIMSPGFNASNKMENGSNRATYTWYDNDMHSWLYESQQETGFVQTCAQAGYMFKDTHTT